MKRRGTLLKQISFRRSVPAQRLRGAPIEAEHERRWDHASIRYFSTRFGSETRFFAERTPRGLDTAMAGEEGASGGYMSISQSVAWEPSGGFRFIGYGITVTVTRPPQHEAGVSSRSGAPRGCRAKLVFSVSRLVSRRCHNISPMARVATRPLTEPDKRISQHPAPRSIIQHGCALRKGFRSMPIRTRGQTNQAST